MPQAAHEPLDSTAAQPVQSETYPFWGYLDLAAFIMVALLGLVVENLVLTAFLSAEQLKKAYVQVPAQFALYAFLLSMLAMVFRRYYHRPFWESIRWVPARVSSSFLVSCGIMLALGVMLASVALRTPDINSPMKQLLSDKMSVVLLAVVGTTIGPACEEIIFRGFLQPLLVRSTGAIPGIFLAALPFALLHLQEYAYSWRHVLMICVAGAAFGLVREKTGSTRAAAIMHASYNFVFFLLLTAQQFAPHRT
ncbi:MAG: type II CAAX endopeptidase family protein [Bryobacteraceae bacterium]